MVDGLLFPETRRNILLTIQGVDDQRKSYLNRVNTDSYVYVENKSRTSVNPRICTVIRFVGNAVQARTI